MATSSDLLLALSRAHDLAAVCSPGDPRLAEALEDVRDAQRILGWVVVRVGRDGLRVGNELLSDPSGDLEPLRADLASASIQEIRFQDVMEPEVLEGFLRRLRATDDRGGAPRVSRFRGLESDLGLSFLPHRGPLPGMPGAIQELFGPRGPDLPPEDRAPPLPAPPPPPRAEAPVLEAVALEMEEKVRAFLASSGPKRAHAREEVLRDASGLKGARESVLLADMVELLAGSAGTDPEALELALDLTSSAVASQLVARLGTVREEGERARLVGIASLLGEEMARALADALGEARDRSQRRSYMDAMIAMGSLGRRVAADMVDDPRWFVVRNGVALLGELGGEEAVSQVTGALANTDPRVRREGVLALGKLGGEDAALLLLGMVDDGEAEVRAMACRALGALKVEKALRPLLRLLETDLDEDVQVQCLQALGQIGDPGAVPVIEKRAVRGLFSRPAREIRIAAYRALAGIGTPHAMELLEKAATDPDTGVRTVVHSLLEERRQ